MNSTGEGRMGSSRWWGFTRTWCESRREATEESRWATGQIQREIWEMELEIVRRLIER